GKCGRFNIPLKNGQIKFISDIKPGDEVLSLDPKTLKIVSAKVAATIDSGDQIVYEVITNKGHRTEVTIEHPFLTPDGWQELGNLKIGDYIATPRRLPITTTRKYDIKKLKLLAYLLGDGGITRRVTFTNKNSKIIKDFASCLPEGCCMVRSKSDPITYRIKKSKNGKQKNKIELWLIKLKLMGCNSHTKFIPDFVFELPNDLISIFLNRLFACDGWLTYRDIGYCSVSKKLIYQVQHLLLRFGIVSNVRLKKNSCKDKIFDSYSLEITSNFKEIFLSQIGNFREKEWIYLNTARDYGDMIPNIQPKVKELYSEITTAYYSRSKCLGNKPIKYLEKEKHLCLRMARNKNLTRGSCVKIAKLFNNAEFSRLANSDIFWAKIKSIKNLGIKKTWDLEIEGTHNFIGDNIFLHNTFLIILYLIQFAMSTPGAFILIGRRFFNHCYKSLFLQTIEPLLNKIPDDLYNVNKSDWIIRFFNDSQIWLTGFDDARRITEIMGREYLMAFLNEATEIEEEMISKVKTRLAQKIPKGKDGYYKPRIFFDCNPVAPEFYLNKRFEGNPPNKARLNWNPYDNRANLTQDYLDELERSLSPMEKQRLIQGLWVGSGQYIYQNIKESIRVDSYDKRDFAYLIGGIDWGYIGAFSLWGINGQNATCIAEVESKGKITTEFLEEIEEALEKIGVKKEDFPVYCDHEPDRIEEAKRAGFRAKKAFKDVAAGDNTVNWFNIAIHNDCVTTYRSMRFLQNQKDKNGEVIEGKHIKIDDHGSDCSRYSLHSYRMEYGNADEP
ncbi:MAG: phage terminase large subunit, partial [bacterium]